MSINIMPFVEQNEYWTNTINGVEFKYPLVLTYAKRYSFVELGINPDDEDQYEIVIYFDNNIIGGTSTDTSSNPLDDALQLVNNHAMQHFC